PWKPWKPWKPFHLSLRHWLPRGSRRVISDDPHRTARTLGPPRGGVDGPRGPPALQGAGRRADPRDQGRAGGPQAPPAGAASRGGRPRTAAGRPRLAPGHGDLAGRVAAA